MSQIEFYTSFLHTYANNGNEILDLIDKILEGEVVWFDPDTLWEFLTLMRGTVGVNQSASVVDTLPPYVLWWQYSYSAVIVSLCVNVRGA